MMICLEIGFCVDVFYGEAFFVEEGEGVVDHIAVATEVNVLVGAKVVLLQPLGNAAVEITVLLSGRTKGQVLGAIKGFLAGFGSIGQAMYQMVVELWMGS